MGFPRPRAIDAPAGCWRVVRVVHHRQHAFGSAPPGTRGHDQLQARVGGDAHRSSFWAASRCRVDGASTAGGEIVTFQIGGLRLLFEHDPPPSYGRGLRVEPRFGNTLAIDEVALALRRAERL